jgi:hypothetical protein
MLTAALALGCAQGEMNNGDGAPPALPDGAMQLEDGAVVLEDGALYQPEAAVPAGPVCDADVQWFRQTLWTPLLAVQCVGCHNAAGAAAATGMVFRAESETGWLEHNFRAARAMALSELAGIPQLLLRPTGRHPMGHTGGTLAAPGTSEYADLERFVARARTPTCNTAMPGQDGGVTPPTEPDRCATVRPGARMLRRLTASEYDRTVRDLLGVNAQYGARFVADPVVDGFDNDAASLVVSPLLAEQLRVAAEALATTASAAPMLSRIVPCTPASPTDAACARRFVETFGERAFRRPLAAADVTRYVNLHAAIATQEGFAEGVEAVVTAMLQSPHFLYRTELGVAMGTGYQLTSWEVASELSYLFTGSMPDAALFEAARSGALTTPAQIEAQARRLLATPGARESLRRFVSQWLDVDRLSSVPKDGVTFPAFTPAVRASMRGEFDHYVDAVLSRRGATLVELLTSPFTFVDPTLAAFYGLTPEGAADAQGFRRAAMLEPQRLGVLGLGAVQTTHARPNSSSPVHRGRLVRERLFCQHLPPPPPGVNAQPPDPDPRRTVREQYAMHSSVRPCVDCHRLIDPIGFTFEFFDGVGRYRAMEAGRPIDGRGEVVGSRSSDRAVMDGRGLIEHLAASPEVHDCFARQVFQYAFAAEPGSQTACALAEVQQTFRGARLSVDELFVALARSVHFTRREGPSTPVMPTPDAGVADAAADVMMAAETGTDAGRDAAMPTPDATVTGPTTTMGVTTMTVRDSTWDTGFCERIIVTNGTGAPLDWTVVHTIAGTVTTSWNSERTGDSGAVVFRGAMWNRTLGPRERTELGFCARR